MFNDPVAIKMWHAKFEPHSNSMIDDIPCAALNSQPQHSVVHKSNSIKDFVQSIKDPSSKIVKRAIREASEESNFKPIAQSNQKSNPKDTTTKIEDPNLVKLSRKSASEMTSSSGELDLNWS